MTRAYLAGTDAASRPLSRIRCRNEIRELQDLLEQNLDLIPGEQIRPDDPRRWLLIKREMPVPDPNSGQDRWSIDFLLGDQDAMPTFVECKRYDDTRSRREVVGQMLEYVANGNYYWTKDQLREFAEDSSRKASKNLEGELRSLNPVLLSVDAYFEQMYQNLQEAQVRIVFFLEESPLELRSLVDFLNRQMERTEVYLVDARLYQLPSGSDRIVIPSLFGYTEEARRTKRAVTVQTHADRAVWDSERFFEELRENVTPDEANAIMKVYDWANRSNLPIAWGTGKTHGSFKVRAGTGDVPCFAVYTGGELEIPFKSINAKPESQPISLILKSGLERAGLLPDDWFDRWVNLKPLLWASHTDVLLESWKGLATL